MRDLEENLRDEGRRLFVYALHLSRGDVNEARDLVAEAARRAAAAWARFDRARSVGAWLNSILKNVHLDRRKSYWARRVDSLHKPIARGLRPEEPLDWLSILIDGSPGPEVLAEREDVAVEVRRAVGRLSLPLAGAVELVDLGGMSYEEAAEVLRVPVGTVRSRLNRARGVLRALLDPALA